MKTNRKIALVTGGSRGIGRAIAIKLSKTGAFVFINYRQNEEAAATTLEIIRQHGGDGDTCKFDVSDFDTVHNAVTELTEKRGSIDILVNNASVSKDSLFLRTRESDWNSMIDTNLKGTFNCCRAVIRAMVKQRWGRIINISSIVAETGNPGQACYAASKSGIIGLTKSLARELGSRNICVNAIAPGFIETDMTATVSDEYRKKIIDQIPVARAGTPDDVANVAAFLISNDADYITGQVINVNGGLYM